MDVGQSKEIRAFFTLPRQMNRDESALLTLQAIMLIRARSLARSLVVSYREPVKGLNLAK